jgi:hypothetical protein
MKNYYNSTNKEEEEIPTTQKLTNSKMVPIPIPMHKSLPSHHKEKK